MPKWLPKWRRNRRRSSRCYGAIEAVLYDPSGFGARAQHGMVEWIQTNLLFVSFYRLPWVGIFESVSLQLIIFHGFSQFFLSVHHKWTTLGNWLTKGLAWNKKINCHQYSYLNFLNDYTLKDYFEPKFVVIQVLKNSTNFFILAERLLLGILIGLCLFFTH